MGAPVLTVGDVALRGTFDKVWRGFGAVTASGESASGIYWVNTRDVAVIHPKCTGQSPSIKRYLDWNVHRVEVEKLCSRDRQGQGLFKCRARPYKIWYSARHFMMRDVYWTMQKEMHPGNISLTPPSKSRAEHSSMPRGCTKLPQPPRVGRDERRLLTAELLGSELTGRITCSCPPFQNQAI